MSSGPHMMGCGQHSTINLIEGLPDITLLDQTKVSLLIIDDVMHEMNEVVAKLFTKRSQERRECNCRHKIYSTKTNILEQLL